MRLDIKIFGNRENRKNLTLKKCKVKTTLTKE